MTGMSAGFAAAANYPAPFVEAGVANAGNCFWFRYWSFGS